MPEQSNRDDEARYFRTRIVLQYISFACGLIIRAAGEAIRTILR